jgi:23S rRNA pseudouridine1911/1915/1917 synthase
MPDYLIINKPSGLMVHPGAGNPDKTLINMLKEKGYVLSKKDSDRPGIVHRLDKDTSGLMIIAKNDKFHDYISNQFENRLIEKDYVAITQGHFPNKKGMIDAPVGRDPVNRVKMKVTSQGSKEGLTLFEVVDKFESNDFIKFKLLTGRTHQLRVHADYVGAPILNDLVYSRNRHTATNFGQFLHAETISFIDLEGNEVTYNAPLPSEFTSKLKELKKV